MDKKSFRKDCLKRLKSYNRNSDYIVNKLVSKKIEQLIAHHKPKSVLFYLPLDFEVNVKKLILSYRKKLKILTPFVVGESFKMVQYRLPLGRNSFNIYEPSNSNFREKRVDMIIVPVVGVDGNFKRVGFGRGMYDRFYAKLRQKPIVVFVQRIECMTKDKITDDHDIRADYYITPKKIKKIGTRDDSRDNIGRSSRWRSSVF